MYLAGIKSGWRQMTRPRHKMSPLMLNETNKQIADTEKMFVRKMKTCIKQMMSI